MSRWEPQVRQRLEQAALSLYTERGYTGTRVANIAERAGVTSRTYFRHFPDKREVLFSGAVEMRERIATALRDVPAQTHPLPAVLQAMSACDDLFNTYGADRLRHRASVIATAGELQEREAHKLDLMASTVALDVARRGVDPGEARLVAGVAVVIFTEASSRWMENPSAPFRDHLHRAAVHLSKAVREADLARPDPDQPLR